MAFSAGYNPRVMLAGYNLSTFLNSASGSDKTNLLDVSAFASAWRTFIPGLKESSITIQGFSDNTAGAVTAVLGTCFASNNKIVTSFPIGDTFGNQGRGMSALESTYGVTSPVDGVTQIDGEFTSNTGHDPIISLRALAAATGTGNGAIYDNTAATSNGGAGYLQIEDFQGTNITVSINHSTDNFASNNVQLLAFAQVTADNSAERVAFSGSCSRYRRIVIAGTFTSVTFQVGLCAR